MIPKQSLRGNVPTEALLVKTVAGIASTGISSESDRPHYYGFRRNRLDRPRDLREPLPH